MCLCSIGTHMLCKTHQKVQEAQPSKNVANALSTILRFVLLFEMTTCTVSPPLRMALPLSWKHGRMANSSLSTNRRKTFTIGSWCSIWLLFMNDNLIIANSSFAFQSNPLAPVALQAHKQPNTNPWCKLFSFFCVGLLLPYCQSILPLTIHQVKCLHHQSHTDTASQWQCWPLE